MFDSAGSFLRSVGRSGDGPGEFRYISHIQAGPEFIHVFDPTKGRVLFDYDFNVVRVDRVQGHVMFSYMPEPDVLLLAAIVPSPRSVGHPFHLLDKKGDVRSFGDDGSEYYGGDLGRVVTGTAEVLWVADQNQNTLTRWSIRGQAAPIVTFDRSTAWFDKDNPPTLSWPRSLVRAIRLDDAGLWLVGHAPDQSWKARLTESADIPKNPPNEISMAGLS